MSEIKDLSRRVLGTRALLDAIAERDTIDRAELQECMQEVGSDRQRVVADDGTDLGTVTLSGGKLTAQVADPAVFFAWVVECHPNRLQVDGAWRSALLRRLTDHGGTPWDPYTDGPIPGVEFRLSGPRMTARPNAAAKERMRQV